MLGQRVCRLIVHGNGGLSTAVWTETWTARGHHVHETSGRTVVDPLARAGVSALAPSRPAAPSVQQAPKPDVCSFAPESWTLCAPSAMAAGDPSMVEVDVHHGDVDVHDDREPRLERPMRVTR